LKTGWRTLPSADLARYSTSANKVGSYPDAAMRDALAVGLGIPDQRLEARAIIAKQIEVDIPTAPVQRHVEVLNEERDKVVKVPVRTDTDGKAT
jgi:hypothetical protein